MSTKKGYENKLFSVLGDSISTLDTYSKPDCAVFYEGMNKIKAEVYTPADTWWGQVIDRLGGSLLVNDSFSGSMVSKHRSCELPSYGCSDERTSQLGRDGRKPDVIMVFMGTNDWGHGVRLTPDTELDADDISIFSVAYESMLRKLQKNYPQADIWCFTLPVSTRKRIEDFEFPYCYGGKHIEGYCDVIRDCAKKCGCRVIDLYRSGARCDTIDGFHPNADGMKTLAEAVIDSL